MTPAHLLKIYRTLWSEFEAICRVAGAPAKPTDGNSIQIDDAVTNNKQIGIKAHCYFPEWRYKARSTKERIQILVQSHELYLRSGDRLIKSNVQVLYLKPAIGNNAQSLLALHYDYESVAQTAHPIFHVQFGTGNFAATELKKLGFRSAITPPPKETLYSSVHIPTACMNFPSVLLGLAADHLEPQFYDRILKLTRDSEVATWNATCQTLETSMQSGRYLPSHHWYDYETAPV